MNGMIDAQVVVLDINRNATMNRVGNSTLTFGGIPPALDATVTEWFHHVHSWDLIKMLYGKDIFADDKSLGKADLTPTLDLNDPMFIKFGSKYSAIYDEFSK